MINHVAVLEAEIDTLYNDQADRLLASKENVSTFLGNKEEQKVLATIAFKLAEIDYLKGTK